MYRHGLLPPAPRRRRLAGGALPGPRPARHGPRAGRRASRVSVDLAGGTARGPGVAGPGRAGPALPARRRRRRQRRRAARRSPTGSTAAAPSTGSARRSCSASAGCGPWRRLGVETQVFHTNEGHAGFLGLERIRKLITDDGLTLGRGHRGGPGRHRLHHPHPGAGRHRPLPPGADGAVLRPAGPTSAAISIDTLMSLGHFPGESRPTPRSTWPSWACAWPAKSNGVAQLHGQTSREMFQALWPRVPAEEAPIGSITNGVHGRTWVSSQMDDLYSKYVSPGVGRGRTGGVGRHRRRPRRRAVAGPGAGPGGAGQLRARAAAQVAARTGASRSATRPGPTTSSTPAS